MENLQSIHKGIIQATFVLFILLLASCTGEKKQAASDFQKNAVAEEPAQTDPLKNKGIGPIREIILSPLDTALVRKGKTLFGQICTACHKPNEKHIGPAPSGILERRTPEWVLNMIMNPEEMIQKDPIAKALFIEYNSAPMVNQNVSEEEAISILEYFRTL